MQTNSAKYTIVLLGIGHTNAHILKSWKMNPIDDCQLVCVSNFPVSTYSGMLPGVLANQYPISEMEIDLVRLCASANVRLILGDVIGIDDDRDRIQFADRPDLPFDALSIGVGSMPSFNGIEVTDASSLVSIKPMQTFHQRLSEKLERYPEKKQVSIAIVGGGIGSIEVAFCLDRHLQSKPESEFRLKLVAGKSGVGSGLLESTRKRVLDRLEARDIEVIQGHRVETVEASQLKLTDGKCVEADIVLWATNAVAPDLLNRFDFEKDDRGFLVTKPTLQVKSHPRIFAVGDTGTIENTDIDKAGVYAVRQGPVLWENLKKVLHDRPLEIYRPQTDYLKLINTADGRSIAEFKGRSFYGRWCWWLKDRIDRKFMAMYQNYEPMAMTSAPVDPDSTDAMRCLGCGGKIGSQILSSVLDELDIVEHPSVIIGLQNPDDAAVVKTQDNQITVTTDFFASPMNDPYLTGRIAMLNSASDCFVMGAQPTAALALIQLPLQHAKIQLQTMRELMSGSVEELNRMNAAIVGGHSIEGPRLTAGFTVLGDQISDAKTKGMLAVGDALVMTKPLGSGVLLAALMQAKLSGHYYQELVDSMVQSNAIALDLIRDHDVSTMTDVTGFGLAGHLKEMLVASNVSAELGLSDIATLSGFDDLIQQKIESTLAPDNRVNAADYFPPDENINAPELAKLFDPQTGGGILLGIAQEKTTELLAFLREKGFTKSAVIGIVTERKSAQSQIVIKRV
ncbi:selenide, water dikinase SelD [bacterium]|nr:selenide, water dikinase SelD [bacterium]